VPTVSRVLTGSIPVSEEKRERVLAAIAELGYRPSGVARALVGGRGSMVGVIALNTTRYGYSRTLEGVVVFEFDPVGVAVSRALPDVVPVVAVAAAGQSRSPHPHAYLDDRVAALEATEYLLGLGHETVHYLAIPTTDTRTGRARGWRQALVEAGIPVNEPELASYDPASGYEVGRRLAEDESVTAVLCGNDELAIGLMRALSEVGRTVPGDVSVVGFDDQPFAAMWTPALTTVAQDFVDLGHRAFALLYDRLTTGTSAHRSSARPRLVVRESTAPPRAR